VLAIECDGATYHSSYTARDRDRLRQQQLENLGWTFHRIWSTDWFLRKEEEVSRAVGAFEKAVAATHHLATEDFSVPPLVSIPNGEPTAAQQPTGRIPPQAPISRKASIADYSFGELATLLTWVRSDGKLRTNDELADEMFAALPFSRRGARIDKALRHVIARFPNGRT
jgi:hypothetical protein